ncbi:MAG TPA: 4Fe-4S dicluster domain-containing protein [Actinomycetales bacterium]|jgi:formate dehydrogenase iron-sulfur subunit
MTQPVNRLFGPLDPAAEAGHDDHPRRKGFFTDTSVCIGCKACEVACKEWNAVPEDGMTLSGMSYDNTVGLGASSWRHVAFIEQQTPAAPPATPAPGASAPVSLGMPGMAPAGEHLGREKPSFRWLMESDVCKHCTHAACLDVCPTGSLMRSEFGTVVVQNDICNGCGYCVPACPYGVIERRKGPESDPAVGIAQKCTLCYDRLKGDLEPACAKACPTKSIQFGDLDDLREIAKGRVEMLVEAGVPGAQLYGNDPDDGVGGTGAFFLLLDQPEVYGLPPDPVVTTRDLPDMYKKAVLAALTLLTGSALAFVGRRGR